MCSIFADILFVDLCRSREATPGAPGDQPRRAICFNYAAKGKFSSEGLSGKGEFSAKGESSSKGELSGEGQHQRPSAGGDYNYAAKGEFPGKGHCRGAGSRR